jgi:hypothetical protein
MMIYSEPTEFAASALHVNMHGVGMPRTSHTNSSMVYGEKWGTSKSSWKMCDGLHPIIRIEGKNLIVRSCRSDQMKQMHRTHSTYLHLIS